MHAAIHRSEAESPMGRSQDRGRPPKVPRRACLRATRPEKRSAFTLIELLVVIGIITILASLLMPALVQGKQQANRIKCLNHLRQVGLALTLYADEHQGQFPPRRRQPDTWITKLQRYFVTPKVLVCPSDGFRSDRSYVINGWNDYFETTLSQVDYARFRSWTWPEGMRQASIPNPSDTIVFGEKKTDSGHVHMDFSQGRGNDVEQLEHSRHGAGARKGSGGSNFAFVDNSVRYLPRPRSIAPVNLWAVVDQWRNAPLKVE